MNKEILEKLYVKYFTNQNLKFNCIDNLKEFDASTIKKGVLFLYAEWSPSHIIFEVLLDSIKTVERTDIELVVLDTDTIDAEFRNNVLQGRSNGYGEIFFIKNGFILLKNRQHKENASKKITLLDLKNGLIEAIQDNFFID